MSVLNFNKVLASGFAALTICVALSWVFVDSTRIARTSSSNGHGFVASASALVR
jgi:hypothetical protein